AAWTQYLRSWSITGVRLLKRRPTVSAFSRARATDTYSKCDNRSLPLPNGYGAQLRADRGRKCHTRRAAGESSPGPVARRLEGLAGRAAAGRAAPAPGWARPPPAGRP